MRRFCILGLMMISLTQCSSSTQRTARNGVSDRDAEFERCIRTTLSMSADDCDVVAYGLLPLTFETEREITISAPFGADEPFRCDPANPRVFSLRNSLVVECLTGRTKIYLGPKLSYVKTAIYKPPARSTERVYFSTFGLRARTCRLESASTKPVSTTLFPAGVRTDLAKTQSRDFAWYFILRKKRPSTSCS